MPKSNAMASARTRFLTGMSTKATMSMGSARETARILSKRDTSMSAISKRISAAVKAK